MGKTNAREPRLPRQQLLENDSTKLATGIHRDDQNHCTMGSRGGIEGTRDMEEGIENSTIPEPEEVRRGATWNCIGGSRQDHGCRADRGEAGCNASPLRCKEFGQPSSKGRITKGHKRRWELEALNEPRRQRMGSEN